MFMLRRRFLWLDITALRSGDERTEFWLTVRRTVRYVQKQGKCSLLSKVATVFPGAGRVGIHAETFSGSAAPSRHPSKAPKRSRWQDRRISPDKGIHFFDRGNSADRKQEIRQHLDSDAKCMHESLSQRRKGLLPARACKSGSFDMNVMIPVRYDHISRFCSRTYQPLNGRNQ